MSDDLAENLASIGFDIGKKSDGLETSFELKQAQVGEDEKEPGRSVDDIMNVKKYHELGYLGKGIKIAILDSGLGIEYIKAIKSAE